MNLRYWIVAILATLLFVYLAWPLVDKFLPEMLPAVSFAAFLVAIVFVILGYLMGMSHWGFGIPVVEWILDMENELPLWGSAFGMLVVSLMAALAAGTCSGGLSAAAFCLLLVGWVIVVEVANKTQHTSNLYYIADCLKDAAIPALITVLFVTIAMEANINGCRVPPLSSLIGK